MLKEIQCEMRQQKADMQNMQEDIKTAINKNINEKFTNLEAKNALLEQKLETQAIKIGNLERTITQRNLLIFGASENEKNYWDLEKEVLRIINSNLTIKCDRREIEYARRLGKKGEKVRPIIITLTTMGLKIKILKNKNKLDQTPYYIKEYFPPEILSKRKELQTEVNREREQGKLAILKYDKIVILKERHQQARKPHTNEKNKRALSESPEAVKLYFEKGKEKPTKINKTNCMQNYILRQPIVQLGPERTKAQPRPRGSSTVTTQ